MQDELEVITGQLGNDPDLAHYGAERVPIGNRARGGPLWLYVAVFRAKS